jgi:thiosulfate/3-mercaptopyruvate sulfurtransferase
MKKLLLFALLCCLNTVISAQDKPILIDAPWLKEHLKDPNLVILQVNFLKMDYDKEHIAGARYLWPELLTPNTPEGNYNVPDLKKANEVLQNLGVNQNSHIIICHVRNEVSVTARIFLTLEHLGMRGQVSFLNGGLDAWKKEGYPVTKDVPVVKPGNFKAKAGSLIVDKNYVLKTLQSEKGIVVDARMQRFYDGEPTGNPRDGHITGAKNIPFTEMVNTQNKFKSLDSLQTYFTPVATKEKELVTYCFIGQTASVVYMAGRILGYEMKLYDGSLQEWSRLDELPMEKTVPKQ